jgi:UPF0755 protein
MRFNGIDQRLAAGDSRSPMHDDERDRGPPSAARYEEVVVTMPEGMRAEEVAELLDVKNIMDGSSFLSLVQGGSASARASAIIDWLPAGLTTLEGYLFPDTYRLPVPTQPSDLLRRMLDNFETKVTDEVLAPARRRRPRAGADWSSWPPSWSARPPWRMSARWWPASTGTASAARAPARPAAHTSRPTRPCSTPRAAPGEWWWKPPSVEAYQTVQSPYNTYLRPGLPPDRHRQSRPVGDPGCGTRRDEVLLLRRLR